MTLFSRAIAVIFGLIGVVVIVHTWTERGFGEPPLFFKLFFTLVASVFVLVGIGGVVGKGLRADPGGAGRDGPRSPDRSAGPGARAGLDLKCDHCGATLGAEADISPSGDVRCGYCQRWFNVRAGRG